MCLSACMCTALKVTRGIDRSPRKGNYRWLWDTTWVLEIQPGSSARAMSAFNYWVITPGSIYFYVYECFVHMTGCVCLCVCVWTTRMPGAWGRRIPWSWSYRQLWAAMWVLGTEPRSSARTASAINHWGNILALLHSPFSWDMVLCWPG